MSRSLDRNSPVAHRRALIVAHLTLLAIAAGSIPARASSDEPSVVILCTAQTLYRDAAQSLDATLSGHGIDVVLLELPGDDLASQPETLARIKSLRPGVVATAGVDLTRSALDALPGVPIIYFLVPNVLDAPFASHELARPVCGVTSDVDPAEQIRWVAHATPKPRRIALLHSVRTTRTAQSLVQAGRAAGIDIVRVSAAQDAFPQAIDALDQAGVDGALMIPDAGVYNATNVQRLLLWGVRNRKPVWTFSANVVRAGAFAGLYCDSTKVGQQVASLVRRVLADSKPPTSAVQYPEWVGRALNVHTAEKIGMTLDRETLAAGVERVGADP